ncbi:hypothetical protein F9L16_14000 [Agarivorans sp. B2Z047]|uniref:DUF5610 domain-containing protein n=1 Tax=Agarivorans sp. B2Z047 TaxID=2652721 RepID=UPI00128E67AD|nr:DUF5610 domain-containing protein [Agarivorans sp. B2Z047]MPW30099.1 hypothetical protein [Agarivorans sp. B2Z047]UQN43267.1 DUF5610 domain-containing protein [Agarivorans sp. B2Z047]
MNELNGVGKTPVQQYAERLLQQSAPAIEKRNNLADDKASLNQQGAVASHVLLSSVEKHTLSMATGGVSLPKPQQVSVFDAEEVARNVLNFVASTLHSAKQSGMSEDKLAEMMAQARKGVDMGFEGAREELSDAGILNEELEKGIDKSYDLIQEGLEKIEEGDYEIQSAPLYSQLAMSSSQSATMELETAEGDKVTISYGSQLAASYSEGRSSIQASFSSQQQFSFSVEGDLNDDELAAIADLIKQVDEVGQQFFSGDLDKAFDQALNIGFDEQQLVGFAVNFQQQQSVAVTQAYQQANDKSSGGSELVPDLSEFLSSWQDIQAKVSALFAQPESATETLLAGILPISSPSDEENKQADVERFKGFADRMAEALAMFNNTPAAANNAADNIS